MPEQESASLHTNKAPTTTLVPSQVVQSIPTAPSLGGEGASGGSKKKKRSRNRRPKKKPAEKSNKQLDASQSEKTEDLTKINTKKPQARKRKTNNRRKRYPWRKHIKQGTVDPISLEPLVSLPYPPFALAVSKPYIPVPIWPPNTTQNSTEKKTKEEDESKRQQQILEQQWGSKIPLEDDSDSNKNNDKLTDDDQNKKADTAKNDGHFHLFDGQVLAYYLVSQLQFIDPLNRRDLTREEIINLDNYLQRHKIKHTSVLEAYDSKGVTLSSAGVSGQTRDGRAEILQQEAQILLNALFENNSYHGSNQERASNRNNENPNRFSRQYAAFESNDGSRRNRRSRRERNLQNESTNSIMGGNHQDNSGILVQEGGGMLIIDDNVNPGLRGVNQIMPNLQDSTYSTSFSAGNWNIPENYPQLEPFPTLMSANVADGEVTSNNNREVQTNDKNACNRSVSKSLLKIGNTVKKTNQKDIVKQRKAREEALRKMELANLPYEEYLRRQNAPIDAENTTQNCHALYNTIPVANSGVIVPTQGQLQRNKNLADALGVMPSTSRQVNHGINGGWKRPTTTGIEFDKELQETQYPDDLLQEAKDRMQELLKLEKKWIDFLDDDTSASCSLKKMDKPTRIFVHKYSDFWHMQTQSYDPEPRRYIHCVKLRDTITPHPLLSHAAKNWNGKVSTILHNPVNTTLEAQCDNQETNDIEKNSFNSSGSALNEQRVQLVLDPRTKPLELPQFQPSQKKIEEEMRKLMKEKEIKATLKKIEEDERKNRILAAAFASDDEQSNTDSEWEIGEAMFSGEDDE